LIPLLGIEGSEIGSELSTVPHQKEDLLQSSPLSVLVLAII
jgi:hypothetical protein